MPDDRKTTDLDAALEEMTPERIERNQRIYADLVARYYGDPDFRAEMDADPTRVLKKEGLDLPKDVTVKLLFNTDELVHLVLPAPPDRSGAP